MSTAALTVLLFVSLFGLMFIGLDLSFAIMLCATVTITAGGLAPEILIAQRMVNSADSFTMIACPLFILSGFLMEESGMSRNLVNWASALFGKTKGGVGVVAIVTCMIFAALTGSGPATVAAIGAIMFPALVENGYPRDTASGMLAAGGSLGPLIPPSIAMIIYGTTMGVSISDMFAGALLPGVVMAGCLIAANFILSRKYDLKISEKQSKQEMLKLTWKAMGTLMMPIIVLGGIYSGIFTATEAAGIAVAYSFAICLYYRKLTPRKLFRILLQAAETNAIGLLILNSAAVFTWVLTDLQIPLKLTAWLVPNLGSATHFMIAMVGILLVAGLFMEPAVNILIFAPLLVPVGLAFGIDLQYLSIVFCTTLIIGFMTPPFGPNIFEAVAITKVPFVESSRGVLPFTAAACVALLLVILIPGLSTWLPSLMGG